MSDTEFPEELNLKFKRADILRYGENPHQKAALYVDGTDTRPSVARARKVQGKELSYNNLMDADAAFECVAEFEEPAAVIVKHMNPCGAALGESAEDAYRRAFACDPVSAFGGIVAINSHLSPGLASKLVEIFLEVVVAPSADDQGACGHAVRVHRGQAREIQCYRLRQERRDGRYRGRPDEPHL